MQGRRNVRTAHCSYLDIYISQKIILFLWWFWRQISHQRTSQYHELFYLKIQINYTHFPSIFCRSFQTHCFLHSIAAIPMTWHIQVVIWCKNVIQTFQPFWNSSNCVQKAVDLITIVKKRKKISLANLNFQIKKIMILAVHWFEIYFQHHLHIA